MKESRPNVDPDGIYGVERAAALVGLSRRTFWKHYKNGVFEQHNPGNKYRAKFSGRALINGWLILAKM